MVKISREKEMIFIKFKVGISTIASILIATLFFVVPSFASTYDPSEVEIIQEPGQVIQNPYEVNPNTIYEPNELYSYGWEVTSTSAYANKFGAWRDGPTGTGPASLDINQSKQINRTFTNTITGDYSIGKAKISTTLGVTIGETKTYGTSYRVPIAQNETKTIIYRPKIRTYKVVSTYFRYPMGTTGNPVALKTETSYVDTFVDWDYYWRYGY